MTVEEWLDDAERELMAGCSLTGKEREAYRNGVRDSATFGLLTFLVRERARHEDDIREVSRDVAGLKRRWPWMRAVEPREHVEVG